MNKELSDLKNFLDKKRKENPHIKIVATNGCFDIIHAGHIDMLKEAKSFGDLLIVGLNSDKSVKKLKGDKRPINSEENRKILLQELKCVDSVCIFQNTTCEDFLKITKPNVYVKAGDYCLESLNPKEKNELLNCGAEIKFTKFKNGLSTTSILNKI